MELSQSVDPGYYRHYKGGEYEVIGIGTHSETGEQLVIYRSLGEQNKGKIWLRPLTMFLEMVVVDGVIIPRFKKLND